MREKNTSYDREHRVLIRRIRFLLSLLLFLLIVFLFVLGVFIVRDDGMRPDYGSGRPVLYLKLAHEVGRGQLVCVRLPDGHAAVRRVVATAGDMVEVRGGIAYINGLAERGNYGFTRTDPQPGGPDYPIILRQGEVFVLGDARETAVDSRSFGVVNTRDLLGRPLL